MVNTSAGTLADRYRFIIGFHGGRKRSAAILSIIGLVYCLLVFLNFKDFFLTFVTYLAIVMFTVLLNHIVDKTLGGRCPNYTARRLTALSIVEMIIMLVGFSLSYIVYSIDSRSSIVIISLFITLAALIGYSVRRAIGYKVNSLTVSILSSFPIFAGSIPLYMYLGNFLKALQMAATSYILGITPIELSLYIIDVKKQIQNIKPFTLLQAFLTSLLSGRSEELEELMSRLGRSEEVKCELFVIKRGNYPPLAIIVSEIHPGPFRAVGSSMFPSLVQQKLAAKGFESVVLKGLSSHEKNIASYRVSDFLAERIASEAEALMDSPSFSDLFTFPTRLSFDGVSMLRLGIVGKAICILTLHPQPMEDLPPDIVPDRLFSKLVVVDAHNSFKDGFKAFEQKEIEKIRALLQGLKQESGGAVGHVRIGFSRVVPSGIGLAEGMGAGGISCIVFDSTYGRTSVVVADANNSMPWVRDLVAAAGLKHGCSETEFCTTDTHMVNAFSLGGRGYHPLGERVERQMLEELFDEIHREAVETLAPASAAHRTIIINDVRVFSNFLQDVAGSVSFGIKTYVMATVSAVALSFIASLLLL